jgi:hypothetical protein
MKSAWSRQIIKEKLQSTCNHARTTIDRSRRLRRLSPSIDIEAVEVHTSDLEETQTAEIERRWAFGSDTKDFGRTYAA